MSEKGEGRCQSCLVCMREKAAGVLRRALVEYHKQRTSKEADMMLYARTVDHSKKNLPLADLFSGLLCKEQMKWQTILLLFAVYNMFSVPFSIAAQGDWNKSFAVEVILEVLEKVGDAFFILEVFFNFYLPYEEEGVQVNVHEDIRKKYLTGWFTVDVIGAVPLEIPFIGNGATWTVYLRLNKLVRFFRLNFYWGRMEKNLLEVNPSLIRLGKFLFLFILSAHWVACVWLMTIKMEEDEAAEKWFGLNDFTDPDIWGIWDKYFQALNFAFVTMVGYGGAVPQTFLESMFSVISVSIGVVMYVVVIGTVGTIMLNLDTAENTHRQRTQNLNAFIKQKNLPPSIIAKVHAYQGFMWRSRQGIDATKTLNDLPTYLKVEIQMMVSRHLLDRVPFLEGVSDHFYRMLCLHLKPVVCLPDTRIVVQGETGREMYFVMKGTMDCVLTYSSPEGELEKIVGTVEDGSHFGEIALLLKTNRAYTLRSRGYCDLLRLDTEDFQILLRENPDVAIEVQDLAIAKYPDVEADLREAIDLLLRGGDDYEEEYEEYEEDEGEEDEDLDDDDDDSSEELIHAPYVSAEEQQTLLYRPPTPPSSLPPLPPEPPSPIASSQAPPSPPLSARASELPPSSSPLPDASALRRSFDSSLLKKSPASFADIPAEAPPPRVTALPPVHTSVRERGGSLPVPVPPNPPATPPNPDAPNTQPG